MPRKGQRRDRTARYTIDHPVGLHCPNKPADVMLIQLLLKMWGDAQEQRGLAELVRVPRRPLKIDGVCGPLTFYWIMAFQGSAGGHPVTGRIDPMPANDPYSNPGRILEVLNLSAQESLSPKVWNALETCLYTPPALARALETHR
jgi:hypothetical protein